MYVHVSIFIAFQAEFFLNNKNRSFILLVIIEKNIYLYICIIYRSWGITVEMVYSKSEVDINKFECITRQYYDFPLSYQLSFLYVSSYKNIYVWHTKCWNLIFFLFWSSSFSLSLSTNCLLRSLIKLIAKIYIDNFFLRKNLFLHAMKSEKHKKQQYKCIL